MDLNKNELYLKDSLPGLLGRLNFSNICSFHDPEFPDPEPSAAFGEGYTPR